MILRCRGFFTSNIGPVEPGSLAKHGGVARRLACRAISLALLASCLPANVHAQDNNLLDPRVNQATISETICRDDYARKVLPPFDVLMQRKQQLLSERGIESESASSYALDLRIPVLLGGAPDAYANFDLRPWDGPDGARRKRRLTVTLRRCVCSGVIPLGQAQTLIQTEWGTKLRHLWTLKCDEL